MIGASKTYIQSGRLIVSANSGPAAYAGKECNPNFFFTAWQNDQADEAVGRYLNDKGFKRVYFMGFDNQAGYDHVNIDEGWWQGTRDSAGNITVDTAEWPGGMSAIADYLHSKGLKAGIYTDAGRDGCGYYFPTGRPAATHALCASYSSQPTANDACCASTPGDWAWTWNPPPEPRPVPGAQSV